jgi:hypothetical protein
MRAVYICRTQKGLKGSLRKLEIVSFKDEGKIVNKEKLGMKEKNMVSVDNFCF